MQRLLLRAGHQHRRARPRCASAASASTWPRAGGASRRSRRPRTWTTRRRCRRRRDRHEGPRLALRRGLRPLRRLPLGRAYTGDDQRHEEPTEDEIREILAHTNKFFPEDELNCGACGYATCRAKAVAVHGGMAEEAMCLPFMIDQAERVCHELNVPWNNLRDVHRHLINTEKLASMGQMAAGVAHELNNPLSTILLYSHILRRKLKDRDDLDHDLKLVADESERCKKIIGNLLDFARQSRVHIETVDVDELVHPAVDGAACNHGAEQRPTSRGIVSTCARAAGRPGPRPDDPGPREPRQERRGGHGRPGRHRARERPRMPASRTACASP